MIVEIKSLKKNDGFIFNDQLYIVRQKYSDLGKNEEPYLVTRCGEIFYNAELEVSKVN